MPFAVSWRKRPEQLWLRSQQQRAAANHWQQHSQTHTCKPGHQQQQHCLSKLMHL
jgi:hypothetical protein